MEPTRNNRGVAHENGAIESAHGHLKAAVRDALLMRGSADFDDLAEYRCFVDEIVARQNARCAKRIDAERAAHQSLPSMRTRHSAQVTFIGTASGSFPLPQVVLPIT